MTLICPCSFSSGFPQKDILRQQKETETIAQNDETCSGTLSEFRAPNLERWSAHRGQNKAKKGQNSWGWLTFFHIFALTFNKSLVSACGFCRRDIGGQRQDEAFRSLLKFPASICEFLRAELTKSTSSKYFTTAIPKYILKLKIHMESVTLKEINSLLPCNPASLFLNATEATCDLKRHTKLTEWTHLQHTCL